MVGSLKLVDINLDSGKASTEFLAFAPNRVTIRDTDGDATVIGSPLRFAHRGR